IGGDGINDESNKTAPAPTRNTDLTKYRFVLSGWLASAVDLPMLLLVSLDCWAFVLTAEGRSSSR
ncbi:hypothetical protein, partial [Bifidobacterium longum]|uniref:hypothetical protein n=1 Tax=Bifidobacterium longum TaxID=216816 RepID=UPI001C700067